MSAIFSIEWKTNFQDGILWFRVNFKFPFKVLYTDLHAV